METTEKYISLLESHEKKVHDLVMNYKHTELGKEIFISKMFGIEDELREERMKLIIEQEKATAGTVTC
ncbi:hypothetical protein [Streptococcus uberis]